jgi:outer membrane protein TolC
MRLFLLLASLATWCSASGLRAEALTLPASVAEALRAGSDASLVRERLELASALEAEAQAGLWPRLSLRGSYAQTNSAMGGFGMILGQRTFDNLVDFNRPGRLDNATAAVDFSYRLYAGGADSARVRAAAAQRGASEQQSQADEAEISTAVVRAFLDYRQSARIREALSSSRSALDASLKVAIASEEEGRLLKAERLNLSVQLAQVDQQLLVADSLVRLSARRLLILLGRPAGEVVEIASLPDVAAWPIESSVVLATRPEILAMRQRVDAATEGVALVDAGRLPTVDFQASYQNDQGWVRSGSGTSWTAGVVARYNLFDGQESSSRSRAARAELRAAEVSLRKIEAEMGFDLARARLFREQADNRLRVSAMAVEQADESARLTRERFQAGKALSAELISVEARLAEARLQLAAAESDQVSARIALRRALAQPLFP